MVIVLTNRGHEKRLRTQLESDREQKQIEREHAMRRDAFLAAIESMAAGCQTVSHLSNQSISIDAAMKPYLEKAYSIAKAVLIAGPETAKQLLNFESRLAEAVTAVGGGRKPERYLAYPKILADELTKVSHALDDAKLKAGSELVKGASVVQSELAVQILRKRMHKKADYLSRVEDDIAKHQLESSIIGSEHVRALKRIMIEVRATMRSELNLENDRDALIPILEESSERNHAALLAAVERAKPIEREKEDDS